MTDHEQHIANLVKRAARGDHRAFTELYDLFAERLYRYVYFRVRDARDAEDLVQRIFLKMIEALPRYEPRGTPFAAWLFRLARNAVIDHHRVHHPHEPLDAHAERPTPGRGPEEIVVAADEMVALEAALVRLTPEQREVVAYRFFAGLSPTEIGVLIGKRAGTVRALQFRALRAMHRQLEGAPGTEGDLDLEAPRER